jgi:hypothetical protein
MIKRFKALLKNLTAYFRAVVSRPVIGKVSRRPLHYETHDVTQDDESYTESHLHKGEDYHTSFTMHSGKLLIWELEQEALQDFSKEKGPFHSHLDFAGGTGRIASALQKQCAVQTILDVSESMLTVAAKYLPTAIIVESDFREAYLEFAQEKAELATAFRFFPNAETKLKEEAMAFLALQVKEGGWLVCNNHRNFWSLPYIIARLTFRGGQVGFTNQEMIKLAERHGFCLAKTYSMGVLPHSSNKSYIPWRLVRFLEGQFFKLCGTKHRSGQNVIFVFQRIA